jgi:hypothetical protein
MPAFPDGPPDLAVQAWVAALRSIFKGIYLLFSLLSPTWHKVGFFSAWSTPLKRREEYEV